MTSQECIDLLDNVAAQWRAAILATEEAAGIAIPAPASPTLTELETPGYASSACMLHEFEEMETARSAITQPLWQALEQLNAQIELLKRS
jgi:hypothetical protein